MAAPPAQEKLSASKQPQISTRAMPNFDKALDHLRDRATDMSGMGRSFERLMKTALQIEPNILGDRFIKVKRVGRQLPAILTPDTIK